MKTIKMLMMAALTIVSISLFAQDSTKHESKTNKEKMEKMKYICPMHPDMVSKKPGKCTKCGMDLIKAKNEITKMKMSKTHTCPMHPDVTSDKPGKCSKCGMALKEKEVAVVAYACPMKCEGEKTYDKPGKCPKCGMALKEKAPVAVVAYACPMKCEGDKTYDKPGKCPVCGMNLKEKIEKTEKKDDHSGHQH